LVNIKYRLYLTDFSKITYDKPAKRGKRVLLDCAPRVYHNRINHVAHVGEFKLFMPACAGYEPPALLEGLEQGHGSLTNAAICGGTPGNAFSISAGERRQQAEADLQAVSDTASYREFSAPLKPAFHSAGVLRLYFAVMERVEPGCPPSAIGFSSPRPNTVHYCNNI
jgi:hypothetical protein